MNYINSLHKYTKICLILGLIMFVFFIDCFMPTSLYGLYLLPS